MNSVMRYSLIVLVSTCLLVSVPTAVGKQYFDVTIKAALIFKFLRFIEWKNESIDNQLIIGIYGDHGGLFSTLENSKPEEIRNNTIEVRRIFNIEEAKNTHLFYVGDISEDSLRAIADATRNTNTLLVTDSSKSEQNVMINIIHLPNNKLSFEINKPNIVYEGLKVSNKLLLHGGSELDVALLYRKMEQVLRRSTDQLVSAKNTLEAQNKLIAEKRKQLDKLKEAQSELKQEAKEKEKLLESQKKEILIKGRLLKENNLELEKKRNEIEIKSNFLKEKNESLQEKTDSLREKEAALLEKDIELESKTVRIAKLANDIQKSTSILNEQQDEVIRQYDLITLQKQTLTRHATTIETQKLMLIAVFGVFVVIVGLLALLVRSYWLKKKALSAAENALDELEKTKTELEITNVAIEDLSEAKSIFLSTLSHEVRNPINAIMGLTEVMLDDELKGSQRDRALNIYSSCSDLVPLLNGILNQSRKENTELLFGDVDFSLSETSEKIVQTQFYDSTVSKVETLVAIEPNVPDWLHGDGLSFKRILINLLSNARKFTHQGMVVLSIKLERVEGETYWLGVSVKDTGEGISKNELPNLFKAYSQTASGLVDGVVGTGLGLSLSQRIVEKLGGELTCESIIGVGSVFSFTFPFQKSTKEVLVNEQETEVYCIGLHPLNILVVDDVPLNCRVCEELLVPHGHRVFSAFDGVEAIDQAAKITDLDVILMDIKMPLMDGVEAAKIIKEKKPDIFIIALTANDNDDDKNEYLAAGMVDVVTKPISGRALRKALASLYNNASVESDINRDNFEAKTKNQVGMLNERFDELVDELGTETMRDMIPELIQTLEGMIDDIESAISSDNREQILKLIHKTKGTSGTYGLAGMVDILIELRSMVEADAGELSEFTLRLQRALGACAEEMRAICN